MALIKCPECGCEVSEFAEKCPKCAYPVSKNLGFKGNSNISLSISPQHIVSKPASISVFGILNIIFGIFGVIGGLMSCTVSQATSGLFGADQSWLLIRDTISFIGSLILISCGIGLCASAQWARSTAVWYGILMSIFSVISLIISLSTMSGLNNMMNNSFFGAGVSAGIMGGIIGGAISILYYLMMAGYLSRSAVTGYFIYKQNNT